MPLLMQHAISTLLSIRHSARTIGHKLRDNSLFFRRLIARGPGKQQRYAAQIALKRLCGKTEQVPAHHALTFGIARFIEHRRLNIGCSDNRYCFAQNAFENKNGHSMIREALWVCSKPPTCRRLDVAADVHRTGPFARAKRDHAARAHRLSERCAGSLHKSKAVALITFALSLARKVRRRTHMRSRKCMRRHNPHIGPLATDKPPRHFTQL